MINFDKLEHEAMIAKQLKWEMHLDPNIVLAMTFYIRRTETFLKDHKLTSLELNESRCMLGIQRRSGKGEIL